MNYLNIFLNIINNKVTKSASIDITLLQVVIYLTENGFYILETVIKNRIKANGKAKNLSKYESAFYTS